jgi:uncharacterized protein YndB with AHSA1/START domain
MIYTVEVQNVLNNYKNMQDIISREIIVKASKEKVYAALTDPQQLVAWFPEAIEEGTLEVGQQPLFIFNGGSHKSRIFVVDARPFEYFSYRWVPGAVGTTGDVLAASSTLVEFFVVEQADGTKVTVKESGFSTLPPDVAETSFKQNSGGWEFMMNRLEGTFSNK